MRRGIRGGRGRGSEGRGAGAASYLHFAGKALFAALAPMEAAASATGLAAQPFDFTSRVAEPLIAASAWLRFGPVHERYWPIASMVLPPVA